MTGLAQQTAADTAPLSPAVVVICLLAAVLIAVALYGYAAIAAERERIRQARIRAGLGWLDTTRSHRNARPTPAQRSEGRQ